MTTTAPLLLLVAAPMLCGSMRVSAPDCTDGSAASCVCGDGSQPDYTTFPPCPLKKVTECHNTVPISALHCCVQGVKKPTCSCPPGESLAAKYTVKRPPRPCSKGRYRRDLGAEHQLMPPVCQAGV